MSAAELRGGRAVTRHGAVPRALGISGGLLATAAPSAFTLDIRDHLVFPGLVNAHDHLTLNAFPRPDAPGPFPNSYAWIEAFQPFLDDARVARARGLPREVRAWHGGLKNLLSGATAVCHHDPWLSVFDEPTFPVRVIAPSGWCHSLGLAGRYGPGVLESLVATPSGAPWFIHLAEGTDDVAGGELRALSGMGALTERTVLVHGVGLSDGDVERVIGCGASVVWCPSSNLGVLGRTLDPRRLFEAGRLALGTDSRLSGSRDLLAELRAAQAASDLTPKELVELVTTAGRRISGLAGRGELSPGEPADLVLIGDPGGDPYEALLHASRADLVAVVRGGHAMVLDPGLASWFEAEGVEPVEVRIDGRLRLLSPSLLAVPEAARLEAGLEV